VVRRIRISDVSGATIVYSDCYSILSLIKSGQAVLSGQPVLETLAGQGVNKVNIVCKKVFW